jgi:hypothetical protein
MNRIALRLSALTLSLVVLLSATSYGKMPPPIIVKNLNDHGPDSLRDAIQKANKAGSKNGAQTINFDPKVSGTINLTGGTLQITTDTIINGPGATTLTVQNSAANNSVFLIGFGNVQISGLTITGGNNSAGGSGITNSGALTLNNSAVSNNSGGPGAGIMNSPGATLVVNNSTLSGNNSTGNGGALHNAGTATLVNSTVSGNTAANGAGIYSEFGDTLSLVNATIAFNTASANGGGIYNEAQVSTNIGNTIVAKNTAVMGPDVYAANLNGTPGALITNSRGGNLIGQTDGSSGWVANDKTGTTAMPLDPLLGPLQNNGGTTKTHALTTGSPAIDMGDNAVAVDPISGAPLTSDQRGFARIVNTFVDIGAFEVQPPAASGSARQLKIGASNLLQSRLPTGDAKTDTLFKDAIAHINKSTVSTLWIDDSHVVGDGNTVFDNEEPAAADLTNSSIIASQQTAAQQAVNALYSADSQLANDEFNYASTHGGNASKLATAQQYLTAAQTDTGQQKVEDYEQAFQNAYHSLP